MVLVVAKMLCDMNHQFLLLLVVKCGLASTAFIFVNHTLFRRRKQRREKVVGK